MILNRKNRKQALLSILACQIIALLEIKDVESLAKMTDNLVELAYAVGGFRGIVYVKDKFFEWCNERTNCNGDCAGCDECEVDDEQA